MHGHKHLWQNALAFLKAFVTNPRATGSIFPSSKYLSNMMASYVTLSNNALVVELGAGTGVITEAMLEKGISPKQIIAIENSPSLVKTLQTRFPEINVLEGDAVHLMDLLKNQSKPIDTIISGLPLRSLLKEAKQTILSQIPLALSGRGRYIQFTYDIRSDENFYPENYHLIKSTIIWRNIPPAKVEVFKFEK